MSSPSEKWAQQEAAKAEESAKLLASIKRQLPLLKEVLVDTEAEDAFYRFYHQSFKVYQMQEKTSHIAAVLQGLAPHLKFNQWFQQILDEGTGKAFERAHNDEWLKHTRPILEAYFHARQFLEMVVRYADLPETPRLLPSGWAVVLYLFNLR